MFIEISCLTTVHAPTHSAQAIGKRHCVVSRNTRRRRIKLRENLSTEGAGVVRALFLSAVLCFLIGPGLVFPETSCAAASSGLIRPEALSQILSELSPDEQQLTRIGLESLESPDNTLQFVLDEASSLWNSGRIAAAVTMVKSLEDNGRRFALGLARPSGEAHEKVKGGTIGTREHYCCPYLGAHNGTGNILIAVKNTDSAYHWSIYFSTDGGANFSETYTWSSNYPIVDIGAIVVGNYFYITYVTENLPGNAKLRRCPVSDGQVDTSFGPSGWITVFDDTDANIVDLELASNQEGNNNRLYLFAIHTDGKLSYDFTDDEGGEGDTDWSRIDTGVSNAGSYLDVSYNDRSEAGTPGAYLFAVYRTTSNKVDLFQAINPYPSVASEEIGSWSGDRPRISAYRDQVVIVWKSSASPNVGVYYTVSEDGGDTWTYGFADTGNLGNAHVPVVSLSRGTGIVIAYQRESSGDDFAFMRQSDYGIHPLSYSSAVSNVGLSLGEDMFLKELPEGGIVLLSIHPDGVLYYDRIPMIFQNGFELGDNLDWD